MAKQVYVGGGWTVNAHGSGSIILDSRVLPVYDVIEPRGSGVENEAVRVIR